MQALKIASVKNKDEGDLKHLSLHFLILRGTLLASQNKSLPVTNARRPINLSTQGRSQVSKQDEASLERRRREPLEGSGGVPPPPLKILKFRGSELLF